MNSLNDKYAIKLLSKNWKIEMDSRKTDSFFTLCTGITLIKWDLFAKYRLICFMQRCCDGMSHHVAFNQIKTQSKKEVLHTLKLIGWQ